MSGDAAMLRVDGFEPGITHPLIAVSGMRKRYGAVEALGGVDFAIRPGEVVGLVGHNGAGKSTLMNILAGTVERTAGTFAFDGAPLDQWSTAQAYRHGLRCVFQELSLCANLTAAENTRIIHRPLRGFGWRSRAETLIRRSLDEVFPGHGVDAAMKVAKLSIAQRQMTEIARAFTQTDTPVRCVILDEPTSALGHEATQQLLAHVRVAAARGIAAILITHRLNEILAVCDRAVVMVDGRIVAERSTKGLTRALLVELMGSIEGRRERSARKAAAGAEALYIDHPGRDGTDLPIRAARGEIVGFAGLDGHGQRERLRAIFHACQSKKGGRPVAYVAGDRGGEGVFALWSIADNLTIRSLRALRHAGLVSPAAARRLAEAWFARLKVKAPSIDTPILSLSGGNQQKVLFARALACDADIVFLDDPMRGVDVGTKHEVYGLIRAEADKGRCFIWYTTELEELGNCERLYVFREGRARTLLEGEAIETARILQASFGGAHG